MRGLCRAACAAALALSASAFPREQLDRTHGVFQQDGHFIEQFADTNTMESYVHEERPASAAAGAAHQASAAPTGRQHLRQSAAANTATPVPAQAVEELNIFLLPHSHDDPGWVRTSDQYFDFFVNDIYTTAVAALAEDKARKFQAVEMIYFSKWYDGASPEQQALAQRLVQNGQLQFAVGGWAMPDEATTDYPDIIETMTTGHQWLVDTFGDKARPQFGFQVDPFGASSAFAALSALMGFNGHIVARLNYFDKGWMQDNKQLEFVWRPDADLYDARGADAAIFTHIMDQFQYSSPGIPVQAQLDNLCALSNQTDCPGGGFFWDGDDSAPAWWWTEQQQQLGYSVYPAVNTSNVRFYSDFMVNSSRARADWFRSPNLLWCFGTDFQWFNASEMFYSMDQIVAYISQRNGAGQRYEGVTIQYGMLSDYFGAVHKWAASQLDTHTTDTADNAAAGSEPVASVADVTSGDDSTNNVSWSVRDDGDFLPYNTLNCAGASQDFSETCSGNAGPQYNVSWPQTWSGFFTSHVGLKVSMRRKSEQLRASKALLATAAWAKASRESAADTEDEVAAAAAAARNDKKGAHRSHVAADAAASSAAMAAADLPWHAPARLQHAISGLRSAVGLLTHHDSQTGTMGPGCGNGDTAYARRRALSGPWRASDSSSTPNFQVAAEEALASDGDGDGDSATCPFLPMGEAGNAGAIDADYEFRLEEGWRGLVPTVAQAAYDLLTQSSSSSPPSSPTPQRSTGGTNDDADDGAGSGALEMDAARLRENLLRDGSGTVTVFNPLGWTLHRWVPVEVPEGKYSVTRPETSDGGDADAPVLFDLMPTGALDCAASHRDLCDSAQQRRAPTAANTAANTATDDGVVGSVVMYIRVEVPPLGLETFTLTYHGFEPVAFGTEADLAVQGDDDGDDVAEGGTIRAMGNAFVLLRFNKNTGLLTSIRDRTTTRSLGHVSASQNLYEYDSYSAFDNYTSPQGWSLGYTGARSGSYLLHSSSATPSAITDAYAKPALKFVISQSGYIKEVRQAFSPTATQVWRLYGGHATDPDTNAMACGFVDLSMAVGPLGGNREHVTLFRTGIDTTATTAAAGESTFWTDNNGLLMQERTYSPSRVLPDGTVADVAPDDTYELALNYYPLVRSANIRSVDPKAAAPHKLAVLAGQAGAVTSRASGELEIMVMRKSLQDDSKGACQVFNDTTGQYATIPNDPSEGDACQGYAVMGTCRPDGCPSYAIPMNISERVEAHFWVLAGAAATVDAREQVQAQVLNNPPLLFYGLPAASSSSDAGEATLFPPTVAPLGVGNELPQGAHLLNLELRVNTSGAPDSQAATWAATATSSGPLLVLRVQNVADTSVQLNLRAAGLCTLLGSTAAVEERSLNTVWALAGKGALDRWDWDTQTVERADDVVDLNLLNRAPGQRPRAHRRAGAAAAAHRLSKHAEGATDDNDDDDEAATFCGKTVLTLKTHDLRTYYVS